MESFFAEMIGTIIFIAFGSSAIAGALLPQSKSVNLSWVGMTLAWALGVIFGVYAAGMGGPGHINPAFTLALALSGLFPWQNVPLIIAGQLIGGFLGALFCYLIYGNHWRDTDISPLKLAIFAAGPARRNVKANFLSEAVGTFLLMFIVLLLSLAELPANIMPVIIGLLIFAVGLSLGGATGPSMNPARDLGPRLAYSLLPIPDKGSADWGYAWVASLGPIVGAIAGAFFFVLVFITGSVVGYLVFVAILFLLILLNKALDKPKEQEVT